MKLLGIDYGRRKIGLAVGDSESKFAEPLSVIRFENEDQAVLKIGQLAKIEKVEKVVLGVSEGKMGEETKLFGKEVEKNLGVPVVFQDETLTTQDALNLSIEAGINRKKRKSLEDAYAACIILQYYLELKGKL
jgi:putative Holliday junction resolvase